MPRYIKVGRPKNEDVALARHEPLKMCLPSSIPPIMSRKILMIEIKNNGSSTQNIFWMIGMDYP